MTKTRTEYRAANGDFVPRFFASCNGRVFFRSGDKKTAIEHAKYMKGDVVFAGCNITVSDNSTNSVVFIA